MEKQIDLRAALTEHLKELHLPTVRECFEDAALRARQESLSYERYLLDLCQRETEMRRQNRIERLLRDSKLPLEKSLGAFDLKRMPQKVLQQANVLLEGHFIGKRENVLAFGNPGSGKTHLLCAIGQELVRKGHRVLFMSCALLVQELLIAKRDLKLAKFFKRLSGFTVLILDDIGYVQQNREEMEVLFAIPNDRFSTPMHGRFRSACTGDPCNISPVFPRENRWNSRVNTAASQARASITPQGLELSIRHADTFFATVPIHDEGPTAFIMRFRGVQ